MNPLKIKQKIKFYEECIENHAIIHGIKLNDFDHHKYIRFAKKRLQFWEALLYKVIREDSHA